MEKQIPLDHAASTYVSRVLVVEADSDDPFHKTTLKCFADGLPGVMLCQSENDVHLNEKKKLPSLFLYGQTVKPITITATGKCRMIVFHLYPHIFKDLFKIRASELTDSCISFDELPGSGREIKSRVCSDNAEAGSQIEMLANYIMSLAGKADFKYSKELEYAVRILGETTSRLSMRDLCDRLNLTERTTERRFLDHIGVSPRQYFRIRRFRSTLNRLQRQHERTLSDLAFDQGYSDQSHFTRSFREFTGLTPGDYRDQSFSASLPH
ncbi:MAG TPA: helix-turn-helix domain-containing protein [Chryseosolibacter sp.]|nr:helix-turn-helix domain-containing protein [Chryseosolibacter sp.]